MPGARRSYAHSASAWQRTRTRLAAHPVRAAFHSTRLNADNRKRVLSVKQVGLSGIEAVVSAPARPVTSRFTVYAIEALCLGLFMLSAATFATLLQHPSSPVSHVIHQESLRRLLMGAAMGATATALIYSPFGARSGAHMNPAVTLAYLRLGKIERRDAAGYISGQFFGGAAGIIAASLLLAWRTADPSVNFIATVPGTSGVIAAVVMEVAIAFLMMTLVLQMTSRPALAPFTGLGAGALVALFIAFEAPFSGMSMNPARTLGSNLLAGAADSLWIYFTAPVIGMQLAALLMSARATHPSKIACPRLYHPPHVPCVFGCGPPVESLPTIRFSGERHQPSTAVSQTPRSRAHSSEEFM